MKPRTRSRYAAAITLSKGKMYEYGVPPEDHLELPADFDLEQQFPLAIGTLGDFAAESVLRALNSDLAETATPRDEVVFSAQVLQAFDDSRLDEELSFELRLLAAVAFYLGDIPGSAAVQVKRLASLNPPTDDPFGMAVRVALDRPWVRVGVQVLAPRAVAVLRALRDHFRSGDGEESAKAALIELRRWAYANGTAHELLMADLLGAVTSVRIANSGWTLLPGYSDLSREQWQSYLSRERSIKEMWPSQRMLGDAGLYRGSSGVVQMPTSAGKSRATELIIRSAFLSDRTKLAVVVAPFRALCQEIANDLGRAFLEDGYKVNQLSDALQTDLSDDLLDVFSTLGESVPQVVVLTPEKLLYLLRQKPGIVDGLGLIVYDEGHQFDTGPRGVIYELLLTSIKRLLSDESQTVLISAVIQNAAAVAGWLLADDEKIVSDQWLQTRRLVAFASLPKGMHGQLQFNMGSNEQEFYVPRVIVEEKQKKLPRERAERTFPTTDSGSIALYLALKLVHNGGVAIYARSKRSAAKIVRDAVLETFRRGISLAPPSEVSDGAEIQRFKKLFEENFGDESYLTKAALLGIFAHHGNTPHGLRLAIEHGMREGHIKLIVCTSTLAQGVNLPIRYLLITSPMQGRESIKARDFHNLMGRAGRAGMYGEGTVIFTDHRLYDERSSERRRWLSALELLKPESAEATGSTLLSLFNPLRSDNGRQTLDLSPEVIANEIVDDWDALLTSLDEVELEGFTKDSLKSQLFDKKKTVEAIESFLMTHRGDSDSEAFVETSRGLASETLAYSLATSEQKAILVNTFERIARRIEELVPDVGVQARYGRTLLGMDNAKIVEEWVRENLAMLSLVGSSDALFEEVWPILTSLSLEKRFLDTTPPDALHTLANGWLAGKPFKDLLSTLDSLQAGYPYRNGKQSFSIDSVVGLCEQAFGFEFALFLAAIREAYAAASTEEESLEFGKYADLLQKRLKYGLPSQNAISYFEAGFSERVIAQKIADEVFWDTADTPSEARTLVRQNADDVRAVVKAYPSYFEEILAAMTAG